MKKIIFEERPSKETLNKFNIILTDFIGANVTYEEKEVSSNQWEYDISVSTLSQTKKFNKETFEPLINSANICMEMYINNNKDISDKLLLTFVNDLCLNLLFPKYIKMNDDEQMNYLNFIRDLQDLSIRTYENSPINVGIVLLKEGSDVNTVSEHLESEYIPIATKRDFMELINSEKPLTKLVDSQSIILIMDADFQVIGFARKKLDGKSINQIIDNVFQKREANSLYSSIVETLYETSINVSKRKEELLEEIKEKEGNTEQSQKLAEVIFSNLTDLIDELKDKKNEFEDNHLEYDFITVSNGNIDWFSNNNFHLSLINGKWKLKHYGILLSYLFEYLNPINEILFLSNTVQKGFKYVLSEISNSMKLINIIKSLSKNNSGALFIIVNQNLLEEMGLEPKIGGLISINEQTDQIYKGVIKVADGNKLNVSNCDKFLLESIASIDGATIMDRYLNIISFGELVNSDRISKEKKVYGARTRAAIAGSKYGLSIKVSEDGDIEVYRDEELLLAIK